MNISLRGRTPKRVHICIDDEAHDMYEYNNRQGLAVLSHYNGDGEVSAIVYFMQGECLSIGVDVKFLREIEGNNI